MNLDHLQAILVLQHKPISLPLQVPLMQVKGPLLVVQLLETTLLCLVNYAR